MIEARHATELQRVDVARRHVDAAELWLRRLVQEEMAGLYGADYFREGVISSDIRKAVKRVRDNATGRIARDIDATSFEQLVTIVTNPDHFKMAFAAALTGAYPGGAKEAKTYLDRLTAVRNSVHHGNGCTSRQLEQAVCYANDLIDSLKERYVDQNKSKAYNVPTFVRVTDNVGNSCDAAGFSNAGNFRMCDFRQGEHGTLVPGDTLIIEVEIDPSFDADAYQVTWFTAPTNRVGNGPRFERLIEESDVAEMVGVYFRVVSKKAWHRYGDHDDQLVMNYSILPPPE